MAWASTRSRCMPVILRLRSRSGRVQLNPYRHTDGLAQDRRMAVGHRHPGRRYGCGFRSVSVSRGLVRLSDSQAVPLWTARFLCTEGSQKRLRTRSRFRLAASSEMTMGHSPAIRSPKHRCPVARGKPDSGGRKSRPGEASVEDISAARSGEAAAREYDRMCFWPAGTCARTRLSTLPSPADRCSVLFLLTYPRAHASYGT
ncbi:uncharacterized protein B0H18DRAFT_313539 [Fomitopsis serialis]|uniref:uncharacterized protein n=1 Tax=Fomitopsis serialis TaxID=139415 RepID=UPI0020074ABD|nr:uncharacterized protein B0H18DRAFT_313539 [Neoantrodia serialis]KAH9936139.1 hypothetical protein B0H18DRAFT_313539 [Neoantrodia serialis]